MRRVGKAIGVVIAVLGTAFVVRALIRDRERVIEAARGIELWVIVLALVVGLASMTTIGLGWRRCLAVLDSGLPLVEGIRSYFVGQLGKYVPGGIWPIVGRAEMARRAGVGGSAAYGSTVLSMTVTYLAAILTATGALFVGAFSVSEFRWWPLLGLLPMGLVALHPAVLEFLLGVVRRMSGKELNVPVPPWGTSIRLLLRHIPAWLGIGVATWLIADSIDRSGPDLRNIVFASSLSWVVGFLAIGVPGGIGVREAVFTAAATSLGSPGVAAAVAVISRVVFIVVDLAGAGISSLVARRAGSPRPSISEP